MDPLPTKLSIYDSTLIDKFSKKSMNLENKLCEKITENSDVNSTKETNIQEGYTSLEDNNDFTMNLNYHEDNNNLKNQSMLNIPVISLGVLNIFMDTALAASIVPILPRELGLNHIHEGIVLAASAITSSIFGPMCGWLSDTKGWWCVLLWFYPLLCISCFLLIISNNNVWKFIISRLIAGTGSGFMYPSNLSMIVMAHESSIRSTAVGLTLAGDLGSLCGPLLGGILYDLGGCKLLYSVMLFFSISSSMIFIFGFKNIKLSFEENKNETLDNFSDVNNIKQQNQTLVPFYRARGLAFCRRSGTSTPRRGSFHCNNTILMFPPLLSTGAESQNRINKENNKQDYIFERSSTEPQPITTIINRKNYNYFQPDCEINSDFLKIVNKNENNLNLYSKVINNNEFIEELSYKTPTIRSDLYSFLTLDFTVRFLTLFYCWGVALSLQALLPMTWNEIYNLSASTIGLLFVPHLICRVCFSALSPLYSDITETPLHILISIGLALSVFSVICLTIPSFAVPNIQSLVLGIFGIGLGVTDGCVTAWTGNFYAHVEITSSALHGRAFALMALACDSGMVILPLMTSTLAQFKSTRLAYIMLVITGTLILGSSIYCGRKEKTLTNIKDSLTP